MLNIGFANVEERTWVYFRLSVYFTFNITNEHFPMAVHLEIRIIQKDTQVALPQVQLQSSLLDCVQQHWEQMVEVV